MDWSHHEVGGILICSPAGRVDEASWTEFGERLKEAVTQAREGAAGHLVIDLAGIDYMSSRGLRALTLAKRQADETGVKVTLAAPNEIIREILAISRYDKLFAIAATVKDAL